MDRTTIIGIIIGIIAVGYGMFLKGVEPEILLNPAAILIIIFGTIASVTVAFPSSEIKRIPKLLRVIFKEQQLMKTTDLIRMFTEWSQIARKEGILVLESKIEEIEDPFLKNGLMLAVDGKSPEYIRDVLMEEIEAMQERHQAGAQIFAQAGTYAPTLGVLGAVVGLIAALSNIEDTTALGQAISAAFVATLLGIFTGYVLWHPFANKLKQKSKLEVRTKYIMIEGILSIIEGEVPSVIEQKLSSFLPANERKEYLRESREWRNG